MEKMAIYNATRNVPAEACKLFDNGSFKGTDINPMWRIKTLTEQFGACGVGWYYEVLSERSEQYGDTVMAIVDLNLFIKVDGEWSKPIYGTGGNCLVKATKSGIRPSDEGYKMALTDALSVACKALGIGADVYFSADRTKYTAAQIEPKEEAKPVATFDTMKAVKDYCDKKGIDGSMFTTMRNACIEAGLLPRIAYGNMTEAECKAMIKCVDANMGENK